MKTRFVVVGLFLLVLSARSASATTITLDGSWLAFQFDAGGAAEGCFGGCVATTNPLASDALAPPWTFSGPATVTVLDLFLSGDTFELFDNLVSVGLSSLPTDDGDCFNDIGCALADASYSRLRWTAVPAHTRCCCSAAASPRDWLPESALAAYVRPTDIALEYGHHYRPI